MRLIIGILAGITVTWVVITLWHILGWPWIGWLFTRVLPETPTNWTPKMRTWIKGELQP